MKFTEKKKCRVFKMLSIYVNFVCALLRKHINLLINVVKISDFENDSKLETTFFSVFARLNPARTIYIPYLNFLRRKMSDLHAFNLLGRIFPGPASISTFPMEKRKDTVFSCPLLNKKIKNAWKNFPINLLQFESDLLAGLNKL